RARLPDRKPRACKNTSRRRPRRAGIAAVRWKIYCGRSSTQRSSSSTAEAKTMRLNDIPGPFSRRDMLRLGGMALAGLDLPKMLRAASAGGKDVSCLIFFHTGGLCQHDSFDPKPAAPAEIRGSFKTIPTKVPGIHFSELLPRSAALLDRYSVIRSVFS